MGSKFKSPNKMNYDIDLARMKSENDVISNKGSVQRNSNSNIHIISSDKKLLGSKPEL